MVSEACVFGIEDEKYGDEIVAMLVTKPGYDQDKLNAHMEEKMSKYKIPRIWRIVDEIPRN